MKDLRLPMDEMSYDELVELGRSAIPALAPGWTDHNAHDPGIMLIELMAWIAEAQMYSIGRVRRDERRAYARILGIEPLGPQPAEGLIWPGPEVFWNDGRVIEPGTRVTANRTDVPSFFTSQALRLTTARLNRVETLFANGSSHDWTRVNAHETATFMPFGNAPTVRDRLVLRFRGDAASSASAEAPLALGFEIVNEPGSTAPVPRRLRVLLGDAMGERRIVVARDSTRDLLQSGILLLDTGSIKPAADGMFRLIVESATGGFARPPRVRRIAINVLPVTEMQTVLDNPGPFGRALPGQQYTLQHKMLVFPSPEDPAFHVKLAEMTGWQIWNRVEDLSQSGPEDRHFELDAAKGILTFGNGVNGRLAPQDAAIQVDYRVCSGGRGNVAKGMRWSLAGIVGEFGTNREVLTGGADAQDLGSLRALARARSRTTHPLVTSQDLIEAALAQTDLGVARAMELEPRAESQRPRGERVLVIVGPRDDDGIAATEGGVESAELLETVRSRLAPRLPVGERLQVRGPVYVPLKIAATLVAAKNTDIEAVRSNVIAELRTRLALVAPMPEKQWPFGRDVTDIAVKGWLRKVHGVARVSKAGLFQGPIGVASPVVKLRPVELPLLRIRPEDIVVERAPLGKIS